MENRAASARSMPRNRAAVMVMPERLVPGTRARIWLNPMISASAPRRCSIRRKVRPSRSAIQSTMPKPIVAQAITSTERR